MTRSHAQAGFAVASLLAAAALLATPSSADEGDPGHLRPDAPKTQPSVSARVEDHSDGFDLRITVRQRLPGHRSDDPPSTRTAPSGAPAPIPAVANGSATLPARTTAP